ncbi:MAG: POTRA domain-containing protein [Prochloraceae cyanobacterium]|nr:POTRA domain-containing protein [Prochloraceae cyanobacterium]
MFDYKCLLAVISLGSIFVLPTSSMAKHVAEIEKIETKKDNLNFSLQLPIQELVNTQLNEVAVPLLLSQIVVIQKIKITGNTVFSEEKLQEIIQPFLNKELTLEEVFDIAEIVSNFYNKEGYTTSFATIAPQNFAAGTVNLEVTEGFLENIDVEVEGWLKPKYVRDRIIKVVGKLGSTIYNQNRLNKALQLLLIDPNVKNLEVEQEFERTTGATSLKVKALASKPVGFKLRTDNGRSPSVGSVQRVVQIEVRPTTNGDRLTLGYVNTDGSNDIDLFYSIRVNPSNGQFFAAYAQNNSQVIETPFRVNDIDFDRDIYLLGYRQPLIETPLSELALGLAFFHSDGNSSIENRPFQLVRGADEDGNLRVSTISPFVEYSNRWGNNFISARSSLNFGVDVFDATNTGEISSQFFSMRLQSQYVNFIAPDTLGIAKFAVQLTPDLLPAPEQLSLGGRETVRGYRQSQVVADNGVFASVEMWLPMWRDEDLDMALQMAPFFDFGYGSNNDGTLEEDNTLFSVGVGLQYRAGERFFVRLDYGIPIVKVESNVIERTLQDDGFYFLVEFNY